MPTPRRLVLLALSGWLVACSSTPKPVATATPATTATSAPTGPAGMVTVHQASAQCVGTVQAPAGARRLDELVPFYRIGAPGKGNLCMGQVFEAERPIELYRVYDGEKAPRRGSYWALEAPGGTRQQYRVDNAICESFNRLTRLTVCTIQPGVRFIVGPGQNIQCEESGESYPASAVNQVTLPSDPTTHAVIGIDEQNCRELPLPWAG